MQIELTGKTVNGVNVEDYASLFNPDHMRHTKASGANDTEFLYPHISDPNKYDKVVVNEPYATVSAMVTASVGYNYQVKEMYAEFDATSGKAIGTHDMIDPSTGQAAVLPAGAVVLNGIAFVETTFTSATDAATIALGAATDAAAGLKAAIAISNGANPWDAGRTALIPVGSAATAMTKLTAERKLQAVVAVEALTAGVMKVMVQYTVVPE